MHSTSKIILLKVVFLMFFVSIFFSCINTNNTKLRTLFTDIPNEYKPIPIWHINGEITEIGIEKQLVEAKDLAGFSGVGLLPVSSRNNIKGTCPKFLTNEYFDLYQDFLDVSNELDMSVILNDDVDFKSGKAGGKIHKLHPEHSIKRIDIIEKNIKGPTYFNYDVKNLHLMSVVAMHVKSKKLVDLSSKVKKGNINWRIPEGDWKIMLFPLIKDSCSSNYTCVDYMDTVAVRCFMNYTYDKYHEHFSDDLGTTIKMVLYNNVGFENHPRSWTKTFNDKFKELNGYDPKIYYPALWYNIGDNTESIRNDFYSTRANLLSNGYPKLVAEWSEKNNIKSAGYTCGDSKLSPIDLSGDVFKFYRYTDIPITNVSKGYNYGKHGQKLVSSVADYYDKPIVGAKVFGEYQEAKFDSVMLFKSVIDLFARGINLVMPDGMWYDVNKVYMPPLVSPDSKKIASSLPAFSNYVGRVSAMLQGGRRVSEIGVLYPIEDLAGMHSFNNKDTVNKIPPYLDYQEVGNILTNKIRRDFTFIHPELFLSDKYAIKDGHVILQNLENFQKYHTLILTGCKVISYKTLQKIKRFYDRGGKIIATSHLPYKSSEIDKDENVITLIKEMFGIDPLQQRNVVRTTKSNNYSLGNAVFIPDCNYNDLLQAFNELSRSADVKLTIENENESEVGKINYIHKVKEGVDIYYFTNTTNKKIQSEVILRGKLNLDNWNPHNGKLSKFNKTHYIVLNEKYYTKFNLELKPVSSTFFISDK